MEHQRPSVAVCIFAYNEENTIQNSIRSFLEQDGSERIGAIYIGANGCTDRTVQRASELLHRDPRLQLIEVAERGKVNMWNEFRRRLRETHAVFTDGDEEVASSAVRHLVTALESNPQLVLAAGCPHEVHGHGGRIASLFRAPVGEMFVVSGRLYAANMRNLRFAMERAGFDEMPKSVIHEDLFLTCVVEHSQWISVPEAISRHPAARFRDRFKREVRTYAARIQLEREFPQFQRRLDELRSTRAQTRNRLARLREVESPARRLALVASYPFKQVARAAISAAAHRKGLKHYTTGEYRRLWLRVESDKQPVAARADS